MYLKAFSIYLSASLVLGSPFLTTHSKKYDDHDAADWCYSRKCTVHYPQSDGSWITSPASTLSCTSFSSTTVSVSTRSGTSMSLVTTIDTFATLSTTNDSTTMVALPTISSSSKTTMMHTAFSVLMSSQKSMTPTPTILSDSNTALIPTFSPSLTSHAYTTTLFSASSTSYDSTKTRPSISSPNRTSTTLTVRTSQVSSFSTPSSPVSSTVTTTTTRTPPAQHTLPSPSQFAADKGSKWRIDYEGDVQFTGTIGSQNLQGDKGRTSRLGNQTIWSFGDVECLPDWTTCGFSMGPAFYGTDSPLIVNTNSVKNVADYTFVQPWVNDPPPVSPQVFWGMDTSNAAAINDTHGVAYAWEIWRGASDGSIVDRGNAAALVTLGPDRPIATRIGPLLSGPSSIQLGLLAILRDGDYIYSYSISDTSSGADLIIGRVYASDDVFDATKYSFYSAAQSSVSKSPVWISTGSIPTPQDLQTYSISASTANPSGKFGCAVYGSVYYNTYLRKYMIVCDIYMNYVNMYISDTPWGPWSAEYQLMDGSLSQGSKVGNTDMVSVDYLAKGCYGSMVHEMYGDGAEMWFSLGPNSVFRMFQADFSGY